MTTLEARPRPPGTASGAPQPSAFVRRVTPYRGILAAAVVLAPFLVHVLTHLDYVPVFDSVAYTDCIQRAVQFHDPGQLICLNHPTIGYFGVLTLFYAAAGQSTVSLLLVDAVLGGAALLAFTGAVRHLFPRLGWTGAAAAGLALSAWSPLAVNALNVNEDFGVLVGTLLLLYALTSRHRIVAIVSGLLLTFSKETGIALYLIALVAYVLTFGLMGRSNWQRPLAALRFHLPLLLVPAAFVIYLVVRAATGQPLFWQGVPVGPGLDLNPFHLTDRPFIAFLLLMFAIGFAWLISIAAAAGVLQTLVSLVQSRFWGRRWQPSPGVVRGVFLVLLLAGDAYALTRYRTFANVRYFLPIMPLLLLLALQFADAIGAWGRRLGSVALAGFAALLIVSAYRTVDPVSKHVYGTFAWGSHTMLHVTSITGECCGLGRDQLMYNLQILEVHYLFDDMLADLHPSGTTAVVVPDNSWTATLFPSVNAAHTRRDLRGAGRDSLVLLEASGVPVVNPPPAIDFLELPYMDPAVIAAERAQLDMRYTTTSTRTYQTDGYTLTVDVMTLKPSP